MRPSSFDRLQPLPFGATQSAWFAAFAAMATLLMRRGQRWLQRMKSTGEPQTADEVLAYARGIERDMPGLAADLRAAAMRHQASAG